MKEPIQLTESAITKIQNLLSIQSEENLKLRIYIVGGGCSGFQYGFGFDDKINEDDFVITKGSVAVVVDAMSIQYMMGSVVDYETTLQSSGFKVKNPNAETTCGCGSSFSLKEESL
jgi:iron-sulfur cluster insertion protein